MRVPLLHVLELTTTGTITTAGATVLQINGGTITTPETSNLSVGYWNGMSLAEYTTRLVAALYNMPDVYHVYIYDVGTTRCIYVMRLVSIDSIAEVVPGTLALSVSNGQCGLVLKSSAFGRFDIPTTLTTVVDRDTEGRLLDGGLGMIVGLLLARSV